MNKKIASGILAIIFAMSFLMPLSFANHGKMCPMKSKDCPMKQCSMGKSYGGHGAKSPCPITNKFFELAHEALEHKAEIGLNDDQAASIKALKLEMKKHGIRQMADMQVGMLDLEAKMKEEPFNAQALKDMIDSAFKNMTEGAKTAVDSYAQLKTILKPEQIEKLKAVESGISSEKTPHH